MRFAMDAHVGDGVEPELGSRVDGAELEQVQTVEEVLLDVAHAVLDPPFLVALGDVTRADVKAPMPGEIG